jgi:hypothetical protein
MLTLEAHLVEAFMGRPVMRVKAGAQQGFAEMHFESALLHD